MSKQSQANKSAARRGRERRKTVRQKSQNPQIGIRAPMALSDVQICNRDYARSLINPFDFPPTCVPWTPALQSQKVQIFARGTLVTGSAGFGFIVGRPSMSSDDHIVAYSVPGFSDNKIFTSATPGVVESNPNSPFRVSDFTSNGVEGRLVSWGIRVRYTGTDLQKNGTMYALEEPNHRDLDLKTLPELLAYERVKITPVTRAWTVVNYQPVRAGEFDYSAHGTYLDSSPYLAIGIQCQTANPGEFAWEAFLNFEAVGSLARGKTSSHVDLTQTSNTLSALGQKSTIFMDRAAASVDSTVKAVESIQGLGKSLYSAFKVGSQFAPLLASVL